MTKVYSSNRLSKDSKTFECVVTNNETLAFHVVAHLRCSILDYWHVSSIVLLDNKLTTLELTTVFQEFLSRLSSFVTSPRTLAYMNNDCEAL